MEAVIDYTQIKTAEEMIELANKLDSFFFVAGVFNVEQYGRHMIIESGHFEYDSELECYIDFEKYGQDHIKHQQGCFSTYGYICRTDTMEEVCELNDQLEENTQTMGGM